MARRAFTLTEALLAVAIGAMALVMMASLFRGVNRLAFMGDVAGTMREGAIALATISRDLSQAVQKPDPKVAGAILGGPGYFQFLRASLEPDGTITGKLVVYQREASPGGNFRMRRRFDGRDRLLPGLYRFIRFAQLGGPGGPFVRVTLRLATHDVAGAAGQASEEGLLSTLVRVRGPEGIGALGYSYDFMENLNGIDFFTPGS